MKCLACSQGDDQTTIARGQVLRPRTTYNILKNNKIKWFKNKFAPKFYLASITEHVQPLGLIPAHSKLRPLSDTFNGIQYSVEYSLQNVLWHPKMSKHSCRTSTIAANAATLTITVSISKSFFIAFHGAIQHIWWRHTITAQIWNKKKAIQVHTFSIQTQCFFHSLHSIFFFVVTMNRFFFLRSRAVVHVHENLKKRERTNLEQTDNVYYDVFHVFQCEYCGL